MSTNLSDGLWRKLASSKRYRAQFVSAQARRAFAFQLRAIMKKRGLSQEELAERAGLTQGVISRAADPNYGKLTITVIIKIANGLDMAYLGTLVPFSDAIKWTSTLSEDSVLIKNFDEEMAEFKINLGSIKQAARLDESWDKKQRKNRANAEEEAMKQERQDQRQNLDPVPAEMVTA